MTLQAGRALFTSSFLLMAGYCVMVYRDMEVTHDDVPERQGMVRTQSPLPASA